MNQISDFIQHVNIVHYIGLHQSIGHVFVEGIKFHGNFTTGILVEAEAR